MRLYDARGTKIGPGATIVYAVRKGSRMTLHEASVVRKYQSSDGVWKIEAKRLLDNAKVILHQTNNIIVVPTRTYAPTGTVVAQVVIHDHNDYRIEAEHKIIETANLPGSEMGDKLSDVFPWLVGQAVSEYLAKLPR
jgi:hypothetical protein